MTRRLLLLSLVLLFLSITRSPRATIPSPHKPASVSADQVKEFEDAIAPYVKEVRGTLPEAKKKYLAGLPKGDIFYVTVKLVDASKHYEQVFVRVNSWEGETIKGTLESDLSILRNYKTGDKLTIQESDVMDWAISKPDGTEKGNFVGKFLDTYKP
jgi:uncharacterized protein YegJ (DUF2314 family)